MRLLLAMITAGLLLAAPAGAADCEKTWSNAAGGDWNSNANWSDGDGDPNNNVPGGDDHACIQLPGNYTVTNSNNATAGEGLIVGDNLTANGSPTLRITSLTEAGNPVGLSLTTGVATVFADGTLELAADGANPGQSSLSVGTLTNLGIVRTVPGPGTSEDKRNLSGSYVNESTGRFEIGKTTLPSNTLSFINRGSITVADGATFNISHPGSGPTFTMETGGLTTTGSGVLKISNGLLNYLGGGAPGNPIQLCGAALNASGSGIANIDFVSEAGCAGGRLVGDIGNNKIVRGVSGAGTNTITIDAPITNQGTLVLTGPSDSQLIGAKLTNEGTLRTEPGGPRLVQVEVATTGTVEIQAATRSTLSPSKEIGIRKALGARKADILKQFLLEAVTLATMGGAMGIFLAWVIGKLVTAAIFPTYLSLAAILGALAVSGSAGAVSGLFPAWKAARLDPIEALRADT